MVSTMLLTPPYVPSDRHGYAPITPPTARPRSGGDASRWHPYTSRSRSSTPTAGLRPPRPSESVPPHPSRQAWAKTQRHPNHDYRYAPQTHQRAAAPTFYVTPDPSPPSVRYSHQHTYSVPTTLDQDYAAFRSSYPALPPTPPRSRSASVEFDGAASVPFCSVDAPQSVFVQQAHDLLMSVYYHRSSAPSMCMSIPGSLPIDPPTLHWFASELVRRASVPSGVVQLAITYIARARMSARRACEARVQTPITPPASPHYPVPPQIGACGNTRPRKSVTGAGHELADPRQMLLGALVLAQKFLVDAAYTSATWGRISGLPTADVAAVERALGTALEWRLWDKNL